MNFHLILLSKRAQFDAFAIGCAAEGVAVVVLDEDASKCDEGGTPTCLTCASMTLQDRG